MKKLLKYKFILPLLLGISFTGCEDFLDVNDNPNEPTDAPAEFILPSAQVETAYVLYGTLNRGTSFWVQHWATTFTQFDQIDRFELSEVTFDNQWTALYAASLSDFDFVEKKGAEDGFVHFEAVGKIMKAYTYSLVTDLWGDVPYSEALQGVDNFTPKYDSQQEIYTDILAQLQSGVDMLTNGGEPIDAFGSSDLMYNGNVDQWIKFANTLQLRLFMRLSQADEAKAQAGIQDIINNGKAIFESNADNAKVTFANSSDNENPLFQQDFERPGDYGISNTLLNTLVDRNDPRLAVYAQEANDTTAGLFIGTDNGLDGNYPEKFSKLGTNYISADSPAPMLTYAETLFTLAEAAERGWIADDNYYNKAVTASMNYNGITDDAAITAYLAQENVDLGQSSNRMTTINLQKWVALYCQGTEAFANWRRTNVPALVAPANNFNPTGEIPVRWPYASDEVSANTANIPAGIFINENVWWDQ